MWVLESAMEPSIELPNLPFGTNIKWTLKLKESLGAYGIAQQFLLLQKTQGQFPEPRGSGPRRSHAAF